MSVMRLPLSMNTTEKGMGQDCQVLSSLQILLLSRYNDKSMWSTSRLPVWTERRRLATWLLQYSTVISRRHGCNRVVRFCGGPRLGPWRKAPHSFQSDPRGGYRGMTEMTSHPLPKWEKNHITKNIASQAMFSKLLSWNNSPIRAMCTLPKS